LEGNCCDIVYLLIHVGTEIKLKTSIQHTNQDNQYDGLNLNCEPAFVSMLKTVGLCCSHWNLIWLIFLLVLIGDSEKKTHTHTHKISL